MKHHTKFLNYWSHTSCMSIFIKVKLNNFRTTYLFGELTAFKLPFYKPFSNFPDLLFGTQFYIINWKFYGVNEN